MALDQLLGILQWATLINLILLAAWGLMMLFAQDAIFRLHAKMIPLTREPFNAIHYGGPRAKKPPWLCCVKF